MKSQYVLPLTIVVAGALIAGAVFWAGKAGTTNPNGGDTSNITVRPYTPGTDYIVGNPQAPIKIVEYMDLECPHCKVFNDTMHQVVDYYNKNNPGQVAWIERPFPLGQIHSKAPEEAQAAECAGAQGGDAAYYKYVDQVFSITPSDNGLDLSQLPVIAQQQGLDVTKFNQCLSSGQFAQKVSDSYAEAIKEGGQGTPYILVMANDQLVPGGNLEGDQPYESMRAIVDAVLAQLPPTTATPTGTGTSAQ